MQWRRYHERTRAVSPIWRWRGGEASMSVCFKLCLRPWRQTPRPLTRAARQVQPDFTHFTPLHHPHHTSIHPIHPIQSIPPSSPPPSPNARLSVLSCTAHQVTTRPPPSICLPCPLPSLARSAPSVPPANLFMLPSPSTRAKLKQPTNQSLHRR